MTDTTTNGTPLLLPLQKAQRPQVVPFGKYKGQPLEALAADREYLTWLQGQSWFRERYQQIYALIINNFGEVADTPEHNAMQVLFLEDDFCAQFFNALYASAQKTVRFPKIHQPAF